MAACLVLLSVKIHLHCKEQDSYGNQLEDVEEEPLLLLLLLFLADWPQGGLLEDNLPSSSVQCAIFSVQCAVFSVQYTACNVQCSVFSVMSSLWVSRVKRTIFTMQSEVCRVQTWNLARSLLGKGFEN